jgi:hypothetical protein
VSSLESRLAQSGEVFHIPRCHVEKKSYRYVCLINAAFHTLSSQDFPVTISKSQALTEVLYRTIYLVLLDLVFSRFI